MAERTITACDVCGEPAAQTIALRVGTRNLKNLCQRHLAEIMKGARPPKRGRKPGSRSTRRTTVKKTAGKKSAARLTSPSDAPARPVS